MNWIKRAMLTTLCCAAASAGPITFTETQNGIGSLGGTPFNNALVTIVLTSNTSTITGGSGVFFDIGPATVTVAGIGTATFTDTMEAVVNQTYSDAGISDETTNRSMMFDTNAAFGTYDLSTAIGPLSGNASGNAGLGFSTSMGLFVLTDSLNNPDHPATFTATTLGSVPEPGTLGLLAAGIALFLIRRRVAA
jgi:hypothetical protein